ncbi:hypothetical protein JHK86_037297 [Glycine max]|nr:hypothetical protein JHK86_037297 [Glycine max]
MANVSETTLENTPTWAVATVCFIMIVISIFIEHLLHILARYFKRKRRKSLTEALEKIKTELMLLGFTSLLLTVSEKSIANICIPKGVGETLIPCASIAFDDAEEETKCAEQGKVSLLSREGVRELQYFIFHLAVCHVVSCILTFGLGMAKMRRWESWEGETKTLEYQFAYDPRRFQLTRQTPFGKRHLNYWSNNSVMYWPVCLVRQFYRSVPKVDYFTLRHGFIMVLLLVGTKLQSIITDMCLDSHDKSHMIKGTLLVRPSDHFFWFGWPKLLLHLISFILFQNSFQLAFFTWTSIRFGIRSCFHEEIENIIIRVAMVVSVQILCGYVTLPLYALVTQMGTSMRKVVFTENVIRGIQIWQDKAKKNMALRNPYSQGTSLDTSLSLETSLEASPSFRLGASLSNFMDRPLDVNKHMNVNITQGEIVSEQQESENQASNLSSFQGFNLQL